MAGNAFGNGRFSLEDINAMLVMHEASTWIAVYHRWPKYDYLLRACALSTVSLLFL